MHFRKCNALTETKRRGPRRVLSFLVAQHYLWRGLPFGKIVARTLNRRGNFLPKLLKDVLGVGQPCALAQRARPALGQQPGQHPARFDV